MKRSLAVFGILALVSVAFFSCTPASSAGNGAALSLSYSATLAGWAPAVSGGAVGVAANARSGSRAASVVTFSSPTANVVQAPTATAVSAAVSAPLGSVALLNTETGYITPLGNATATITVKATDASGNSTSVQVTTAAVAFADTTPTGKKWTITSCTSANGTDGDILYAYMKYQVLPAAVFSWSLRANSDDSSSVTPSKTYRGGLEPLTISGVQYEVANQLNAGYFEQCTNVPGVDYGWVAIDGNIFIVAFLTPSPSYGTLIRGTKENPIQISYSTGLTTFSFSYPASLTCTFNTTQGIAKPYTGGITQDVSLNFSSN